MVFLVLWYNFYGDVMYKNAIKILNILENNGFEANKDYTANDLDEFVQKHGSKQVKFINWKTEKTKVKI